MAQAPDLADAIAGLERFGATWNPGAVIDEESGLTADDVDAVVDFVGDFPTSD
jgi:hypothetical protein